jgi:hypothetical protein
MRYPFFKYGKPIGFLLKTSALFTGFLLSQQALAGAQQVNSTDHYQFKYDAGAAGIVTSTLEITPAQNGAINFGLMTVAHNNICEVRGIAEKANVPARPGQEQFAFDYQDCHLTLTKIGDSFSTGDTGGTCVKYFCGTSGVIDQFKFDLVK